MATFTWSVVQMNCYPEEGGHTDVVFTVHWTASGEQTDGDTTYTGSSYGSVGVPLPEGTFTPYANLTQDQVLGWCWANGVDKNAAEAAVQTQIDNQINPPVIQPPLPWA